MEAIFEKKIKKKQKNLVISKKNCNFAVLFQGKLPP